MKKGAIAQKKATEVQTLQCQQLPIALRIKDAVNMSGLSRTKLYDLIAKKELAAIKAGGRRLILRRDLEAFLEGMRPETGNTVEQT